MRSFTHCINVRNVNEALHDGLIRLKHGGVEEPSRNGSVVVMQAPVITCYAHPEERVLFSSVRDANPFFHLMEALWMLAGRRDVMWPTQFNSTFGQFSDDGINFHGAYGHRWREHFGYDQLPLIISELRSNPESRRCVLSMWNPGMDLPGDQGSDLHVAMTGGKDVPCNTNVFFRVVGDQLDIMVNCRSNDIVWGAYGANAVHMSVMQEYIARSAGLAVGRYWQNSFNFHAYTNTLPLDKFLMLAADARAADLYSQGKVQPYPLMQVSREAWDGDLALFMEWAGGPMAEAVPFHDPFFNEVAVPMRLAWSAHKDKDYPVALMRCNQIAALDWRAACRAWVEKRADRHAKKRVEA